MSTMSTSTTMAVNRELVQRQQQQQTAKKDQAAHPTAEQTQVESNPQLMVLKLPPVAARLRSYWPLVKVYAPWLLLAAVLMYGWIGRQIQTPTLPQFPEVTMEGQNFVIEEVGVVASPEGRIVRTPAGKVGRGFFSGHPMADTVIRFTGEQYVKGDIAVEALPGQVRILVKGRDGTWHVKPYNSSEG